MAGPPWLVIFIIQIGCFRTAISQATVNVDTQTQFAAFVGARDNVLSVGRSFQEALAISRMRADFAMQSSRAASSVADAGVVGICGTVKRCDPTYRYRTADGTCNNLDNPSWGSAVIPMKRWLPPVYDDGESAPRTRGRNGKMLPSARFVSVTVHGTNNISEIPKDPEISHMVMQWGHFTDHDITHAPIVTLEGQKPIPIDCCNRNGPPSFPCFPIPIPPGDPFFMNKTCMNFVRSIQVPNSDCTFLPVEQMNSITSFVDSSNVYGSGDKGDLRMGVNGLLKITDGDLLPPNGDSGDVCDARCFDAGDVRRNEQMGLTSMHTLMHREHNRVARTLLKYNPHWGDEQLFQESRKIVGAMAQKITYYDWLSVVLDPETRSLYGLDCSKSGYDNGYDPRVDPSIRNVFGAAAFRFGHSLVRSAFSRRNPNYLINRFHQTSDIFGKTSIIRNSLGHAVGQFLRGMLIDRAGEVDRFVTPELTNLLFKSRNGSLDLAALNIQRGRDHGIAPYNDWREWCGLPRARVFVAGPGGFVDHRPDAVRQLTHAYRGMSPDDVDLFPAALSEAPLPGGILGPTFACLVAHQFSVIKKGDRFWYELNRKYTGFTPGQLRELQKASLGRIMCDNTHTFDMQKDVFRRVSKGNPQRSCRWVPKVDLSQWQEYTYHY